MATSRPCDWCFKMKKCRMVEAPPGTKLKGRPVKHIYLCEECAPAADKLKEHQESKS